MPFVTVSACDQWSLSWADNSWNPKSNTYLKSSVSSPTFASIKIKEGEGGRRGEGERLIGGGEGGRREE